MNILRLKLGIQYLLLGTLLLLAACQPATPTPTPLPQSAWGSVITLARAEQTDAPALAITNNGLIAAWVGADDSGVFQALRAVTADGMNEPIRLPLPVRPYAQQFAPASADRQHLFWLDSNVDGETRLFTALLKPNLERDRELTILTRAATRRYTLLPIGQGAVWAIASAGLASEPALVAHYVDGDGRWRLSEKDQIAAYADWPTALQHTDGTWSLFWLRTTDSAVMQAGFIDGQLVNPHTVVEGLQLNAGDRLESFNAAQDTTHLYLFWNVTRADGRRETWFTTSPTAAPSWQSPVQLRIAIPEDTSFTAPATSVYQPGSGFNSGVVFTASAGNLNVSWAKPAAGLFPILPIAAQVGQQIGLIFFRTGHIVAYRPMNLATQINLIGAPTLIVDRDLYLYLAWSQPDPAGYANLQLTSLKLALWPWITNPHAD